MKIATTDKPINMSFVFFPILFLSLIFTDAALAESDRAIAVTRKPTERRTALVIGNSDYASAPLKNPANDARDMAKALEQSGFDVTLKINATQREMEEAVRAFGAKLRQGGAGLFYYAGHGIQIKGRNYLIPIGATIESESDVKYEAVDAGLLLGKMEDAGNNLNIVILDACRNNPFARSFRSAEQGLARMDAPKGSLIAYATAPGSVAADGEGRNGVYTKHLIQSIKKPSLTIEEALKQVRISVLNETSSKQVPWESSSLTGNFYFNTEKAGTEDDLGLALQQSTQQNLDAEEEMWQIVKSSDVIDDIQLFLDSYPNGRFKKHARLRMDQLLRQKRSSGKGGKSKPSDKSIAESLSRLKKSGHAHYKENKWSDAVDDFEKALKIDPNDSWTLKYLADSYQANKQYEKALSIIDKAIRIKPDDEFSYQVRGNIHYKEDRWRDAIDDFERALKIDADDAWTLKYLADSYQANKQYAKALQIINKAIRIKPNDEFSYKVRGHIHYKEDRWRDAIDDFEKALKIDPDDSWTLKYLADSCQANKQYAKALQIIDKAIRIKSDDEFSYKVRGHIHYKEKRWRDAIDDFERALKIDPDDAWTLKYLADSYQANGQYAKALQIINKAIRIKPDDEFSYKVRGHIHYKEKRWRDAIRDFEKALKIDPDDSWTLEKYNQAKKYR